MKLKRKDLLKNEAYIDGLWCAADKRFTVINPADGQTITDVSDCDETELDAAIVAAEAAFPAWAGKTAKARGQILRRWYDLIIQHADDLAALMTAEQGKPLAEARAEIIYGASFVEWFSEEGKRAYGDVIPATTEGTRMTVLKQPVGVCAAITPWNFPHAMITRKVSPALAAGCTVVIKPAGQTPLSALALAVLAEEAGVPAGVLNIVTSSDAAGIGEALCADQRVRKISFTGSTEVGKILMRQSADTLKRLSLELGGNAPFIVFDDADIDAAVKGLMESKFRNAGQTCVCPNRVYVHDSLYDAFAKKLTKAVEGLKVGNGADDGVQIGPLIDEDGLEKVKSLVVDAVDKGATVLTGGKPHALGGTYYQPTVLTDMDQDMDVSCTEIFGPVIPLYRFTDEDEVIKRANNVSVGLASYFYCRDHARAWRVAEALETGIVTINAGGFSSEAAPFGGVKESGFGREGSKYGLDEYLNIKYCFTSI